MTGRHSMSRRAFHACLAVALAALTAGLVACGGGDDPGPVMDVDANGTSTFNAGNLAAQLATYPLSALSTAEADSLAFNISASEATHSAAVKTLLDRYQLADPLAGLASGTFRTPAFQSLYNSLVATSRISLVEALKVGVQIEELDMRDITVQKAGIDNADILMVYDNLLRGSRNHLRAFMKVLTQQGGTYVPQYISQAAFDAIVNSPVETGP